MNFKFETRIIAQSDLGQTYAIIKTTEKENGDIDRTIVYTSPLKNRKGMIDCNKMLKKFKSL